jgi:hypothetical protein
VKRIRARSSKNDSGCAGKLRQAAQVSYLGAAEGQLEQVLDGLLESGSDDEIPLPGQVTDEQLEGCNLVGFAGLHVAGRHGELVQIGKKTEHVRAPAAGRRLPPLA